MTLQQYAETDRQTELLRLRDQGYTIAEIAEQMGMSERNAFRMLQRIKQKAATMGYSPDHDMNKPVPDGFVVSGVSTYTTTKVRPQASGSNLASR